MNITSKLSPSKEEQENNINNNNNNTMSSPSINVSDLDAAMLKDRFVRYDLANHQHDPEKTGVLPNDTEYHFGMANLDRNENITLFGSNTGTKERILIKLKWRPAIIDESEQSITKYHKSGLVSLISDFQFTANDGKSYEFNQIESYKPNQVELGAPGHERLIINQYGSNASKLKLYISSPYRRMRFVFNGYMRQVETNELVLVRFGCVLNTVGQIFDFLAETTSTFSPISEDSKGTFLDLSKYHDRHEQKVRFHGEYSITSVSNQISAPSTIKQVFTLRGFHSRHLLNLSTRYENDIGSDIHTNRLYVYLQNGKSFQIGAMATRKNDQVEYQLLQFGYTHFGLLPLVETIEDYEKDEVKKTFELICGGKRDSLLNELLTIHSKQNDETLICKLMLDEKLDSLNDWFEVEAKTSFISDEKESDKEINRLPGWALLLHDDELFDSMELKQSIEKSLSERRRLIEEGKLIDDQDASAELDHNLLVVSIEDSRCASSDLVGAKASSLAQLLQFEQRKDSQSDYKVPLALVMTRFAYDLISSENPQLKVEINKLVNLLTRDSVKKSNQSNETVIQEECNKLIKLVEGLKLPKLLADQLLEALNKRQLGSHDEKSLKFAVRSSSWGEDEGDMSAAGQLTTILNVEFVNGDLSQLSAAIMACFASKFSYQNIQYKRQHGLPIDLPMAVVVQDMISCDRAGVMFTCNPVNGDESKLTITANYGLGESVVSAAADPDSVIVGVDFDSKDCARLNVESAKLSIVDKQIGKKEVVISSDALRQAQLNQMDKSKCCLTEAELLKLARVGLRLRQFYSTRQQQCDIEWGFKSNQLYLFQCRPVTGLESYSQEELMRECDRAPQTELTFLSRANVGEVMPFAIRPLTVTYTVVHWGVLASQITMEFLEDAAELRQDQLHCPHSCAVDGSQQKYLGFYNLFGSSFITIGAEDKTPLTRAMELGIFGRELEPQTELIKASRAFKPVPSVFGAAKYRTGTRRFRLNPTEEIGLVKKQLDDVYKQLLEEEAAQFSEFSQLNLYDLSEKEKTDRLLGRYDQMRHVLKYHYDCWHLHCAASVIDSELHMQLNKVLAEYINDPVELSVIANKLLALSTDIISAEIPSWVRKISRAVQANSNQMSVGKFLELDDDSAAKYLSTFEEFRGMLERFGHRCYNEFDFSAKTWRESPERLVEMVKTHCRLSSTNSVDTKSDEIKQQPNVDEILGSIKSLSELDRLKLKYMLIPRCQLFIASRERTKNTTVLYFGCMRLVSRMFARELQFQMRLPDEELFYFLTYDEVKPLCLDFRPAIVMQASMRRQLFKRHFADDEPWKFEEIITSSELIPNHLKENEEIDAKLKAAPKLFGTPASSGKVRGKICLVRNIKELNRVESGSILLTYCTDVAFTPVFTLISGIITEVSGLVSHGAVIAREYGLPAIIGIPNVTKILEDGEEILLDADKGTITRLSAVE